MFERIRRTVLFLVGLTIPLQSIALGSGVFRGTAFKGMVAILLVFAAFEFAQRSGGRPRDAKTLWVIAFATSFGVSSAMSAIAGVPYSVILGSGTTMAALSLYYLLLSYALREIRDLRVLIWGIVIGGAVTLGPAASDIRHALTSGTDEERLVGLTGQANALGANMVICVALSAGLFFMAKKNFARLVAVGTGAVAVVGVGVSLSRSAFVSLGAIWLFWMVRSGSRGAVQTTIPALILAIVVVIAAPTAVKNRFMTMIDARQRESDYSIQERIELNWLALVAFASNPVVGVGSERFRQWAYDNQHGKVLTIHNAYLYVAAEQGLFGIIPLLALLTLSWRDYSLCWRAVRRHRLIRDERLMELGEMALYLQAALLSGLIGGMFHQAHKSKGVWTLMAISPVLVSLVNRRLAEIRGTDSEGEAEPLGELPALGGGRWMDEPVAR